MSIITVCALVVALFAVQINGGKKEGNQHQFEYEFKVLKTLVDQEEAMEKIRSSLNGGNERITELTEFLETTYDTISHLNATVNILQSNSGSSYIRWGRTTCDGDAEVVYDGYAAGTFYTHKGSGSNYLCLPRDAQMVEAPAGGHLFGYLYGVEYQLGGKHQNNDAPCVVCRIPRSDVLMTPGRNECHDDWVQEYSGYLVSDYDDHYRTEFVCLDKDFEYVHAGSSDKNGALFYYVKGICGSLRCPPYEEGRELACVVCSYGKRG